MNPQRPVTLTFSNLPDGAVLIHAAGPIGQEPNEAAFVARAACYLVSGLFTHGKPVQFAAGLDSAWRHQLPQMYPDVQHPPLRPPLETKADTAPPITRHPPEPSA
jgi:hypothetical protein